MDQYKGYVAKVYDKLGSVPFEEIDEPTFREVVQKMRGESSRKGGYSDSTLEKMVGIFRDWCRFAERC